jgi:hypothetical protein
MIARPWAVFTTDLPDDQVEDENGILVFPGRNIAEAIGEVLLGLGADVEPPKHEFEHGWTARLKFKGHGFWYQVSVLDPQVYLVVEDNAALLTKKEPELYAELVTGLNEGLAADLQVHDLLWYSREDGPRFPPDGTGSQDPFSPAVRRPRRAKPPRSKTVRAGPRLWPRFLARLFGWLLLLLAASAFSQSKRTSYEEGALFLPIALLLLWLGYRAHRAFDVRLPWVRDEPK